MPAISEIVSPDPQAAEARASLRAMAQAMQAGDRLSGETIEEISRS